MPLLRCLSTGKEPQSPIGKILERMYKELSAKYTHQFDRGGNCRMQLYNIREYEDQPKSPVTGAVSWFKRIYIYNKNCIESYSPIVRNRSHYNKIRLYCFFREHVMIAFLGNSLHNPTYHNRLTQHYTA